MQPEFGRAADLGVADGGRGGVLELHGTGLAVDGVVEHVDGAVVEGGEHHAAAVLGQPDGVVRAQHLLCQRKRNRHFHFGWFTLEKKSKIEAPTQTTSFTRTPFQGKDHNIIDQNVYELVPFHGKLSEGQFQSNQDNNKLLPFHVELDHV